MHETLGRLTTECQMKITNLRDNIEEDIMQEVKDSDGYLNIGR